MPWLSEAMKDVTSCEKLRGGANIQYIRRYPNGATLQAEGLELRCKSESKPGELKHLSTRRKIKQIVIPRVVAIEMGIAQTDNV